MKRFLSSKISVIGILIFLLMIGLGFIRSTVAERQAASNGVMNGIAREHVGPQSLIGPVVMVPVREVFPCEGHADKTCGRTGWVSLMPERVDWSGVLNVEEGAYQRGIYKAISYRGDLVAQGRFDAARLTAALSPQEVADWSRAEVRVYLADMRGMASPPELTAAHYRGRMDFPAREEYNPLGMSYTRLTLGDQAQAVLNGDFRVSFRMEGLGGIQLLPVGKDVRWTLRSNWPDAGYHGAALPAKTRAQGAYQADWSNSYVASRNTRWLDSCLDEADANACNQLRARLGLAKDGSQPFVSQAPSDNGGAEGGVFGVRFIRAVDVYLMTDRALKYAALFLMISFGGFFLFEILRQLRIHPVQYTLVGLAQGVFYLLLLSFSEHMSFGVSYAVSAAACLLLIMFYLSYVLQGIVRSFIFTGIMAALYFILFLILQSEDYTLMLGSILVFLLLAVTMVLTRRVDWYAEDGVAARTV